MPHIKTTTTATTKATRVSTTFADKPMDIFRLPDDTSGWSATAAVKAYGGENASDVHHFLKSQSDLAAPFQPGGNADFQVQKVAVEGERTRVLMLPDELVIALWAYKDQRGNAAALALALAAGGEALRLRRYEVMGIKTTTEETEAVTTYKQAWIEEAIQRHQHYRQEYPLDYNRASLSFDQENFRRLKELLGSMTVAERRQVVPLIDSQLFELFCEPTIDELKASQKAHGDLLKAKQDADDLDEASMYWEDESLDTWKARVLPERPKPEPDPTYLYLLEDSEPVDAEPVYNYYPPDTILTYEELRQHAKLAQVRFPQPDEFELFTLGELAEGHITGVAGVKWLPVDPVKPLGHYKQAGIM